MYESTFFVFRHQLQFITISTHVNAQGLLRKNRLKNVTDSTKQSNTAEQCRQRKAEFHVEIGHF